MTSLRLTPATLADADLLLAWANDPATRAASFGRAEIARDAHVAWLAASLADPDRRLWVAHEDGRPVGQVRIDRSPDLVGTVSIGLAPDARGRGLGREVLRLALVRAAQELRIRRARAVVLRSNVPSRRLFEGAGFVAVGASVADSQPAPAGTGGATLSEPSDVLVLEVDLAASRAEPYDP
jgi:RimJ/RimL family protein N-acetyltransferase